MYRNFSINEKEKRQILEMHTTNGYKRSLNEEGTNEKNWSIIYNALIVTKPKEIKMRDGDYSLNWGSHSGPGHDWGLSIAKKGTSGNGTFAYQGENSEKAQRVRELIEKYGFAARPENYNNSLYSDNIYSISTDKFISLIKEILITCRKSS